ncbi:transglycosylase domain-containing protein [Nesterenkonia ebinurensis]|uniref:transglycosylase domain-containing protein n=1 Tax=Nesterenkonia ebinurensis TaxID=2608252 RepID=UPI00123E215A|nr:transglycosylase domain-containing protein [Nesterenkonia ebinurensis]
MSTPPSAPRYTATTMGKILSFLGVSALCGALTAGLLLPVAATGGATASLGSDILDEFPPEMREKPISVPSTIYARDGETEIATFYAENRDPVELEQVAPVMQDAIIAIEDERFYEHNGTDVRALARAAANNLTNDTRQGASTITHQYVSQTLLNADYLRGAERLVISGDTTTFADRVHEARLAIEVEQEMTKEEILEGYLNIVFFGGNNYGVEATAQYLWGVSASELNLSQAATLAGLVQNPNGYNPATNPEAAQWRRDVVLSAMLRNEMITQDEHDQAVTSALDLNIQGADQGCISADFAHYFCDYVQRMILTDETFGDTPEEREELLLRGGLEITTTLDPDAQLEAETSVQETVPAADSSGAVATITSVEPGTGNVLTMAQSTEYDPDEENPERGNTTINLNVDSRQGGSGGFPVGSTLKPFIAVAWLEDGGSMDDVIDAGMTEYEDGDMWQASCVDGGQVPLRVAQDGAEATWPIVNVIDDLEQEMTIDFGLYYSVNTATVNTAYNMDLCAINDVTERLGITTATNGEPINFVQTPSAVLGATELSPMTLAEAYATFANEGERCEPRAILGITDTWGDDYQVPEIECEQVLDPDIVAEVNDTLINIAEESIAGGTAPFPMAGKTGTSQSGSNTWFVGSTEGVTTTAQIGRFTDSTNSLFGSTINDQYYEEFYGSTLAAPMWLDYMNTIAGEYPTGDFPESPDSPFDDRREYRYAFSQTTGNNEDSDGNGNEDNN